MPGRGHAACSKAACAPGAPARFPGSRWLLARAASGAVPALWITDDVTRTIYRVTLDGRLVASFPSPTRVHSSVAVDPVDGTLWGAAEATAVASGGVANYTRTGGSRPR